MAARLRAMLYRWGWLVQRRLPVPVISIGNLTVGGTGKTPVVILLAEWLLAEKKRVAILSRGYGRASGASMLLVSDGTQVLAGPQEAGDEPHLIARRCPQAIVAVGSKRYELGRWVLERFPLDCILLDDGFQHLGLHRDVNLLLMDATDLNGQRAVIPAGRLREPLEAAARATAILITRAESSAAVELVTRRLREMIVPMPAPIEAVFRAEALVSVTTTVQQPLQWCLGKTAVLCSGIGHAASFRATAQGLGLTILGEVAYADHHRYTSSDLDRLRAKVKEVKADVVITTEKDAGKLAPLLTPADSGWWAVRLRTEITAGEERLRQSVLRCSSMTPPAVYA